MDLNSIAGWTAAGIVALGVAWAPVACTMSNNEKIASAIQDGADPIVARCTYSENPNPVLCAVAAVKGVHHE